MDKLLKSAKKIIHSIEERRTSFWVLLSTFISLVVIRILIENLAAGENSHKSFLMFYEFFDSFAIAYLLSLWIVHKILAVDFRKAANIFIIGYSIIIIPPIADYVISYGKGFLSFYAFDSLAGLVKRFFTFFGNRPDIGITYGVRAEILIAVILILVYSYLKSRNILKSVAAALSVYLVLFFLGTFPSWITIATEGISKGFLKITEIDVVQMFFSPFSLFSREINAANDALITKTNLLYILLLTVISLFALWKYQKIKFYSFLRNIRIPQILYHIGLLAVGLGTALIFSQTVIELNFFNVLGFLVLSEAVIFSWLASVVANDIFDKRIDAITNAERPLLGKTFSPLKYKSLGLIFFTISIYTSFLINPKISFFLIAYQAITWIYSAWPFRLKRFAFISTFISALASILIFFSGYILASPAQDLSGLPASILIFLIFAYTFSVPLKDFKDIEGDKGDKVNTIPVIFGEYWGKIIVGSGIFVSFLSSVLVFNEPRLFWWALILGGISFWLVNKMKKNPAESKINYENIFWWILGMVFIYGAILVDIIILMK